MSDLPKLSAMIWLQKLKKKTFVRVDIYESIESLLYHESIESLLFMIESLLFMTKGGYKFPYHEQLSKITVISCRKRLI